MTQFARPTLNAAVDDGITLSTKFNGAMPALYTNHAGAAAPPSPELGQLWWDTSGLGSTPSISVLQIYDGTVWRTIGTQNFTTGLFTTAGGLPLTGGGVSGPILFPGGTAAAPSVTFTGDTDTGMFRISADQIGFSTVGVQRVQIGAAAAIFDTTNLQVRGASAILQLDRASGAAGSSQLTFRVGTSPRWTWNVTGVESTANAGSNLFLSLSNDDGSLLVNYLQIGRASRQMGVNGAAIGTGILGVRTAAVAIGEDAIEVMNTNADTAAWVGMNFRTGPGAIRGAIRGERSGNNGDLSIWTTTGSTLSRAATFSSNGGATIEGGLNAKLGLFSNQGSCLAAAGNGVSIGSFWSAGGNSGVNVAVGNPNWAQMEIQFVHVPAQFASVRLNAGTGSSFDFRSDWSITRQDGATVMFAPASDRRIKENIKPTAVDALTAINALEVVSFDYIPEAREFMTRPLPLTADKDAKATLKIGEAIGFVAQQIQAHTPEAVTVTHVDKPGLPKDLHGVDNSAMVPYLVRALQQQQEMISSLESRLAALEGTK